MRVRKALVFLSAITLFAPVGFAATWYVATNGNDSANGTNWATAKQTIQAGVDKAMAGDTVLVSNGVYSTGTNIPTGYQTKNRVAVTNNITVQSVNGPAVTFIVGHSEGGHTLSSIRCVFMKDGFLSGFTLTDGSSYMYATNEVDQHGGALLAFSALISNCIIARSSAEYRGGGVYGGTLKNCGIFANQSSGTGSGAGIGGGADHSSLIDCSVTGNIAYVTGGGIADSTATNCLLSGNWAMDGDGGGAMSCSLYNCLVVGNRASDNGGGVAYSALYNCTICRNRAGIWGGGEEACSSYNSIITDNVTDSATYTNIDAYYAMEHTCTAPMPPSGSGNITNVPQFVNGYHLQAGSPCIDAGNNTYATNSATDIDGNDRIVHGTVDMGAYEVQMATVTIIATNGTTTGSGSYFPGSSIPISATASNRHWFVQRWNDGVTSTLRNITVPADGAIYWAAFTQYVGALTLYATTNGNDLDSGLAWAAAKQTIQGAVDATLDGDTVLVSNGVYATGAWVTPGHSTSNRVVITNAILVQSMNGPALTRIVGANGGSLSVTDSIRCVFITNAVLSGFMLTNGAAPSAGSGDMDKSGGGAYAMGATLTNCIITGCACSERGGGAFGGLLLNCVLSGNSSERDGAGAAGGTMYSCVISGNSSGRDGGGVLGAPSAAILRDCTVSSNRAVERGGGVSSCMLTNCTVSQNVGKIGGGASGGTLNRCVVIDNVASNGGGLGGVNAYNCLLVGNSATTGGAASAGTLVNCTVVSNSADVGGGLYGALARNSIVWSNTATTGDNYAGGAVFAYTCTTPLPSGAGNASDEPRFADAAAGDYRLLACSRCLNKGTNSYVQGAVDLDGSPRIFDAFVDMGAYEYQGHASWSYNAWVAAITNGLTNYADCATGDGYPNLLKYATGSSATNADELARLSCARSNGLFAMTFNRNTNAGDVTLIIEAAGSLSNEAPWVGIATNVNGAGWSSADVTESGTGTPISVSARDAAPSTNRFTRLRVLKP